MTRSTSRIVAPALAYYNEHDPFAAAWLRELIKAGHISPGDVDERSIEDVCPDDLAGYVQCHFFAGIGVWSHARRLAGWPDNRALWTGSCPCQPFSAAGKGAGFDDERHLWPAFFDLIQQCNPPVVVGEQVASKDGLAWLDLVSADMEGSGYAGGAVDLCAAGFGAPHIRQRLYFAWLADAARQRCEGGAERSEQDGGKGFVVVGEAGGVADPFGVGRQRGSDAGRSNRENSTKRIEDTHKPERKRDVDGLVDADMSGEHERASSGQQPLCDECDEAARPRGAGPINGFWRDGDWLLCRSLDGEPEWRAVETGTFPLAHGVAGRMGLLRGYGNAINAEVAKGFLEAVMECIP